MIEASVILTGHRRPQFAELVEAMKRQTAKLELMAWLNDFQQPVPDGLDVVINSSANLFCWPRWWLASMATSDLCFIVDDDMIITDNDLMRRTIDYMNANQAVDIVGRAGVMLTDGRPYHRCMHLTPQADYSVMVDVVKGQFMCFRRSLLTRAALMPEIRVNAHSPSLEDDIYISSLAHIKMLIPELGHGLRDGGLRDPDALWRRADHYTRRDAALQRYFDHQLS